MKKMLPNEKIDYLYSVILALSGVIIILIFKLLDIDFNISLLILLTTQISIHLPVFFRRKKQFQKINKLCAILHLSIEEVRSIANIGRYDLVDWRWEKSFVSQKKIYFLEEQLEKKYFSKFGKEFES